MKATGDKLVLEKQEQNHEHTFGDIIIPSQFRAGANLTKAKVLSIGSQALDRGVSIGDIVLYDHHSVYYDTHPVVVTRVENIICLYNEDKMVPLTHYVVLEEYKREEKSGDIAIPDSAKQENKLFKIVSYSDGREFDKDKLHVVVSGKYDITLGIQAKTYRIVPEGSIIATIED